MSSKFIITGKRLIAIESSTGPVSVAISSNNVIKASSSLNAQTQNAPSLLTIIDRTIKDAEIRPEDIDAVFVGTGPGSFTSIRVTLSTAQGIAKSLKKPIFGIGAFPVLAQKGLGRNKRIIILQKAYQGKIYFCASTENTRQRHVRSISCLSPQECYERIMSEDLLMGNGVRTLLDLYPEQALKGAEIAYSSFPGITGVDILECFLQQEEIVENEYLAVPTYMELTEAERNYSKKHGLE